MIPPVLLGCSARSEPRSTTFFRAAAHTYVCVSARPLSCRSRSPFPLALHFPLVQFQFPIRSLGQAFAGMLRNR
jgi:hypothetical protein